MEKNNKDLATDAKANKKDESLKDKHRESKNLFEVQSEETAEATEKNQQEQKETD